MKKTLQILSTLTIAILLAVRVTAGPVPAPMPPPPVDLYGTGWYGAIELGANIYQDRGDTRTFTNGFGDALVLEPTNDTGFFGGVKIGYVFGTGSVRFALEEDMFYNGWQSGADSVRIENGVVTARSATWDINTAAFMTNGLIRFGTGPWQPYIGFGIGFYYAESGGSNFGRFEFEGGANHTDFAWQAIAGMDYYFNPKFSAFIEYKFLEYTGSREDIGDRDLGESRVLGQQLLGAGLRFHF